MKANRSLLLLAPVLGALLLLTSISSPMAVYAAHTTAMADQGSCILCHEDLYFLHDTGNWYCLREAPMSCVDCHGGNPLATTRDQAHVERRAHPVLNEDISKCQECHPQECNERMQLFDQTAGISEVRVAMAYTPKTDIELSSTVPSERPGNERVWMNAWELLQVLVLVVAAVTIYVLSKKQVKDRKQP